MDRSDGRQVEASTVEVVDNSTLDRTCPDGYFRVKWVGPDGGWRAMIFPVSDRRLIRYVAAVEQLKAELGVYADDDQ